MLFQRVMKFNTTMKNFTFRRWQREPHDGIRVHASWRLGRIASLPEEVDGRR